MRERKRERKREEKEREREREREREWLRVRGLMDGFVGVFQSLSGMLMFVCFSIIEVKSHVFILYNQPY